ncbi:MAG: hypothetical protein ACRD7E_19230 [Bryobacteraceae bacterium]
MIATKGVIGALSTALIGAALLVAIPVAAGSAAMSDAEASRLTRQAVSAAIAKKYSGEQMSPDMLRARRVGEWEDSLGQLRLRATRQPGDPIYFYRITDEGWFAPKPDEVVVVTAQDGHREWVVAVSSTSGTVFGLYGFDDAPAVFNRLIRECGIKGPDENDAVEIALQDGTRTRRSESRFKLARNEASR